MRVKVAIGGHTLTCMIDTGSSISLITDEAVLKLLQRSYDPCSLTVLDFSNNPIRTVGALSLVIFPGTPHALKHDFLVISKKYMKEDVLLGMDALSKGEVKFNYHDKVFCWMRNRLSFRYGPPTNLRNLKVCYTSFSEQANLILPYDMNLKPGEIQDVEITANPHTIYEVTAIHLKKVKDKVLLAKSFVLSTQQDSVLSVPICNMTHRTVRLQKGTLIGKLEPVQSYNLSYLDYKGNNLGTCLDLIRHVKDSMEVDEHLFLCPAHSRVLENNSLGHNVTEAPLWECYICQGFPSKVRANQVIDNAMVPRPPYDPHENLSRVDRLEKLISELDLGGIGKQQKESLTQLLIRHEKLSILDNTELGLIKVPENTISLVDTTPVRMPLYRHPERAKDIIETMIQDMLSKGIIEPSYAAYLSPIVLISKPDGSKRMCIDYRAVNTKIKIDIHPLPRLDELLDDVAGHGYYCTLDLKDAYYQCLLDEPSRDITTFSDGKSLFRFKRLPFGLSVAPAIFTRVMQEVLRPLVNLGFVRNYLDDVIIFGPDIDTLLEHLELVFKRMSEMGLKLNVAKCNFCKKKIKFLGHYVSKKGIEVNPASIESITKMNAPRTTKEVRRFIGMASFYRKFIPKFSKIASPLTALQSKKVPFVWSEECERAFIELKEKLTQTPVLVKFQLDKPLELHTDASNLHVGAVLMQREEDGLHPVGFFSKKLNKCEKKYGTPDKEALAVCKAVRFFHHYLWGTKFLIVTDHEPLIRILKGKPKTSRMSRYKIELRGYSYEVAYKKGAHHYVPDALSRPPVASRTKVRQLHVDEWSNKFPGLTKERLQTEQRKDPIWDKVIKYCEGGGIPRRTPGNRALSCFELIDDILYVRREEFKRVLYCLVIPKSLRGVACHIAHNATHLGQHKSVRRAQQYFYWPRLWKDVVHYVKSCRVCQQFKPEGALIYKWQDLPAVNDKGKRVAIDLIDMYAGKGGYRYCLTIIDHFSRFLRAYPLRNKSSNLVLNALKKDMCIFGVPEVAVMDNGSEFSSREFKSYCQKVGINQVFCLPYHPRGNSVLERAQGTLKSVLATLSLEHPNSWPGKIGEAVKVVNESVHTSLGTSPFYIQFGYHPRRQVGPLILPEQTEEEESQPPSKELRAEIQQMLNKQTKKYRDQANVKRRNQGLNLYDLAWVYQEAPLPGTAVKLNRKWEGPFRVVQVIDGGRAYELENMFEGARFRRAAEKIKRYIARDEILGKINKEFLSPAEESVLIPAVRNRRPPDRYRP